MKKKRYQFKKQFIKTINKQSIEKRIALTKKDYLSECIYVAPLKEGDKLFIESDDMSDSFLNRSKANNEIVMPEAYINTALWLLDLIKLSNNNLVKDGYIFPALYCFRHYLEFNLWNSLRNFIDDEPPQLRRVCKLIKELDELDKSSTTFRYSYNHNKKGKIIEYDIPTTMINVYELKNRVMQLYCFFEGINHLNRVRNLKQ